MKSGHAQQGPAGSNPREMRKCSGKKRRSIRTLYIILIVDLDGLCVTLLYGFTSSPLTSEMILLEDTHILFSV